MPTVTITLPDVPAGVDAADTLRACVDQITDGRPLADLRSQYVREILGRLAAASREIPQRLADRDPNVLARQLADALDELATERAAHEETRDELSVASDHRTVLGAVADTARELTRELRHNGPNTHNIHAALSVLEAAIDTLDMEEDL